MDTNQEGLLLAREGYFLLFINDILCYELLKLDLVFGHMKRQTEGKMNRWKDR